VALADLPAGRAEHCLSQQNAKGASWGSGGGMGRARVLQLPSAEPAPLVGLQLSDPPALVLSTLNFPLKNRKCSLMLNNYEIAKLEVVRAH